MNRCLIRFLRHHKPPEQPLGIDSTSCWNCTGATNVVLPKVGVSMMMMMMMVVESDVQYVSSKSPIYARDPVTAKARA